MKVSSYKIGALVVALLALAVLPVTAGGLSEQATGRQVQPSEAIVAFFEARGVDGQYLGKAQGEVPAEQWREMVRIVNFSDYRNLEDESTYNDDGDVLYSLVMDALFEATDKVGESVHMSIGGRVWTHTLTADQLIGAAPADEGESA